MKTHLRVLAAVAAVMMVSVLTPSVQAQAKSGDASATKARGDNPVKADRPTNVEGKPKAAPPGGAQTRGASMDVQAGWVCVYNGTGYYVDIYIDGDPSGTVNPYGTACGYVGGGTHSLYGRAPGTTLVWGPGSAYTGDGFTWNLH